MGHNTDVLILDEMDCKTVQQYTPAQLNGILEGYLDVQVAKKHQVSTCGIAIALYHNRQSILPNSHRAHPYSNGEGMQS